MAAGEFSKAADSTTSSEALRTLHLLEEHHRRLAELLKLPLERHHAAQQQREQQQQQQAGAAAATTVGGGAGGAQSAAGADGGEAGAKHGSRPAAGDAKAAADALAQGRAKPGLVPGLASQRSFAGRELSSSIASNLASARGIRRGGGGAVVGGGGAGAVAAAGGGSRGQPASPSVSTDTAPGTVDHHLQIQGRQGSNRTKMQGMLDGQQQSKPGWVPPAHGGGGAQQAREEEAAVQQQQQQQPAADEGFSRFYSTFGSLFNRLSAPLAFAGLPLIAEESSMSDSSSQAGYEPAPTSSSAAPHNAATATNTRRNRLRSPAPSTVSGSPDPDLSKIYSKATLRALTKDGQHQFHTASDSFYVVPTSGQTVSYANILSFAEKEKRRMGGGPSSAGAAGGQPHYEGDDVDDDDFVDAREQQQQPLSPGFRKRLGKSRSEKELRNVIEELYLENKSLKDMVNNLSRRLHAFEANAQVSSLALAESMRLMRPGSPLQGQTVAAAAGKQVEQQHAGAGVADEVLRRRNRELEEQLAESQRQAENMEHEMTKMHKNLVKYRDRWDRLKTAAKERREGQGLMDAVEDSRSPDLS